MKSRMKQQKNYALDSVACVISLAEYQETSLNNKYNVNL